MPERNRTPKRKFDGYTATLPPLDDFDSLYYLRCHSEDNDPNDNETKVWRCAFEPRKDNSGNTNVLATCGGNIVCFIDCISGRVLRRYKDDNVKESFYTLAWTTLETTDGKGCNILAVAGEGRAIKLIHPSQLVMYGKLHGHKKYVSCLLFHPSMPHCLFSGGQEGLIYMWHICKPDGSQHVSITNPVLKIDVPDTDAINLVFCLKTNTLLAACEEACLGWNLDAKDINSKNKKTKLIPEPSFKCVFPDANPNLTVDGLASLHDQFVATKQVGTGRIHIWDLAEHASLKKKKIKVQPLATLEYAYTDVDYLNFGFAAGILAVGDDKGSIFLYNVENILKKKKSLDSLLVPSKILEWPVLECDEETGIDMKKLSENKKIVVNAVAVSADKDYIAFGTDNNLVCILNRVT
ncbi:leucine-rich repeat and WD repeat-containing protein 1-like [Gigantopelta aegis]|uniref:leucine-rich repeat and WD repeat-containing protein 1-like n=1 Tax=Gigantopelta aegis TaxID=1735272 RepID=UPI001B88BC2E|nr:leucine-rich repeat and WD repeat-containing protein 1-like [Gigantopelta aegis]XP_041349723.1 leucine-rich repeat and WD repeat-containing protein 1-like [Gigantopelta aegis]XP_041349724.1 leucine-rich repeat and WD repeat-containing protein 1-like [Gigantopelta aegis]XP_041349725.1 leucine-rich repeat and WD repeat-containing protein 1-like [Gigantopelta aegis]